MTNCQSLICGSGCVHISYSCPENTEGLAFTLLIQPPHENLKFAFVVRWRWPEQVRRLTVIGMGEILKRILPVTLLPVLQLGDLWNAKPDPPCDLFLAQVPKVPPFSKEMSGVVPASGCAFSAVRHNTLNSA